MGNCIKLEFRKVRFRYNKCKWVFLVEVKLCTIIITIEPARVLQKTRKKTSNKSWLQVKKLQNSIIYRTN